MVLRITEADEKDTDVENEYNTWNSNVLVLSSLS